MRIQMSGRPEGKPRLDHILPKGNISLDQIDEFQAETQVSSATQDVISEVENNISSAKEEERALEELVMEEIRKAFQRNKPFRVEVRDSSGEIQGGWIATGGNKRGEVVVMTEEPVDGRVLSKTISLKELLETNKDVFLNLNQKPEPAQSQEEGNKEENTPSNEEQQYNEEIKKHIRSKVAFALGNGERLQVKVETHPGLLEDGWVITDIEGDKVSVQKITDGKNSRKTISPEELGEANRELFLVDVLEGASDAGNAAPLGAPNEGTPENADEPSTAPAEAQPAGEPNPVTQQEKAPKDKLVSERWGEVRAEYKAYKNEIEAAQQEYLRATEAYENKRHNAGFVGRFMKSSAFDEEKKKMLDAEKKYDALLDGFRNKRQERLMARKALLGSGLEGEKRTKYIAQNEALLERFIDHEVHLIETLRYNESEQGESRNKIFRRIKTSWNWYRKLPLAKRLAVSAAVGGAIGALAGATGLAAGGAVVVGATVAARRAVGGLFGSVVALETKRFGDSVIENYEKKKLDEQQRSFKEKELSRSRRERLGIKQATRWQKRGATVAAAGAAVVAGGGASSAFNSVVDTLDATQVPVTPLDETPQGGGADTNLVPHPENGAPESGTQDAVGTSEDTSVKGEPNTKRSVFDRSRERADLLREKVALGRTLAQKMGFSDLDNLQIKSEGNVPTMINGKEVPMSLLTQEQQQAISAARKVHSLMNQGGEPNTEVAPTKGGAGIDVESDVDTTQSNQNTAVEVETKGKSIPVTRDFRVDESTINSGPKVPSSNIPEYVPGSTIDDAFADAEIMELYEKLGVTNHPETLKMEGVYEAGSSVERELQQFLGNNDWVKEQYPDLTDTERGAIAHRIRLQLEEHPDMAEKLKVQKGDWSKVLRDDKYSFYIDRDLVEQEIDHIHGKGVSSASSARAIVPDEIPQEKPGTEVVPAEPTPNIQQVEEPPSSHDAHPPSKSVAEEMLEEMRKENHPVVNPEEVTPTMEEPPTRGMSPVQDGIDVEEPPVTAEDSPIDDRGVSSKDIVIEEAPREAGSVTPTIEEPPTKDTPPAQEVVVEEAPQQKVPAATPVEQEIQVEAQPEQAVTVEVPKTLEEDLWETKNVFRERGLDYQGNRTSPYLVEFFTDGTFNEMLRGQKHLVLSNWGPISHARLEDILDGRGSLTFAIGDNPPVTMGAQAEQLCRSVLAQLERGLGNKIPNIHEIVEAGRRQNITLGELVKQLSEEVQEQSVVVEETPSLKTEMPTSVPDVSEAVPLEEYTKPSLVRQTTSIGVGGVQASYRAELPPLEVSSDIKDYVQKQYLVSHSEWNTGNAKDLYSTDFDFKRAVDLELADIALALRGDENIPLSGIIVDWNKFDGLTPREVLEQLEQHEDLLEKMNQTEKILDPNVSINVEQ